MYFNDFMASLLHKEDALHIKRDFYLDVYTILNRI